MAPAKILIVTSGPLCRNPRPWKEACALGAAGHDVTVLTVAFSERNEAFDRELIAGAPFRKIAVSLGSARAGLPGLARRGATWLSRRAVAAGWQTSAALGPARALAQRAASLSADLVSVHTELGFFVGSRLRRAGRALLADFEDWHSEDLLPEAQRHRPLGLIRRLEREMMTHAKAVTAPSQAMADALHAAFGGVRPEVIRNSFPLQSEPPPRPAGGPPALFWFSQTVGPGRMLEPFLAAWRLTREPSRLRLLGEVAPAYRAKLLARLPPERRSALEFLPLVSPVELPALIAGHDLGLALEADLPPSRSLTITNKILQYLNAGVGVLATPTAGQREALADAPGAGLLLRLQETQAAARAIDGLLADPGRIAAMGQAARRAARERLSWEHDAARLQSIVQHALQSLHPARPR